MRQRRKSISARCNLEAVDGSAFETNLSTLKDWYLENTVLENLDAAEAEEYLEEDVAYIKELAEGSGMFYEEYIETYLTDYYNAEESDDIAAAFEEALLGLYVDDLEWDYILQALAVEYNLAMTQQDYNEYMVYIADDYGYDYDDFMAYLEENYDEETLYINAYMEGVWEYVGTLAGFSRQD